MAQIDALMTAQRPFLTDGGLETWLFFQQGFEAPPEFAAIMLLDDKKAREALRRYFDSFLTLAERAGTGFVLDTCTWRGCVAWAPKLGIAEEQLLDLSRKAAAIARETRTSWQARVPDIILNGVVGPAGDGYFVDHSPSAAEARALHAPQVRVLADGGMDMISAITMTNIGEATGIAEAARDAGLPVVISFTVETDGRLPTGQSLAEAIDAVDSATDSYPAYYMVNCAHPDHFRGAITEGEQWTRRIGGLRANASRKSHEELDNSEVLDEGDPVEFGRLTGELKWLLPNLRVLGGCCGTDDRHIGCIARELNLERAAA